jgi:antitoxin component of RelBE/YafQ-DinJ toxin-antitoxin module
MSKAVKYLLEGLEPTKKELFQCRVDAEKLKQIIKIRDRYGLTWADLIERLFERLIEEEKKK